MCKKHSVFLCLRNKVPGSYARCQHEIQAAVGLMDPPALAFGLTPVCVPVCLHFLVCVPALCVLCCLGVPEPRLASVLSNTQEMTCPKGITYSLLALTYSSSIPTPTPPAACPSSFPHTISSSFAYDGPSLASGLRTQSPENLLGTISSP